MRIWVAIALAGCASTDNFAGVDRDTSLYRLPDAEQVQICHQIALDIDPIASAPDANSTRWIACGAQRVAAITEDTCNRDLDNAAVDDICGIATVRTFVGCWDPAGGACSFFTHARDTACGAACFTGW